MTQLSDTQIEQLNAILQSFQTPPYVPPAQPAIFRDAYSLHDDFGADNTGVNPADAALQKAIDAGISRLYVPGYYRFNKAVPLVLPEIYGDGMLHSGFNCYNSMGDGAIANGPNDIMRLRDFTIQYRGTSPQPAGMHGLRAQRKIYADSLQVKGFTNDGIFTDSIDGTIKGAAFYSRWDNVWSKNNGRDGFAQRFGANCHQHNNCQYDKNKRFGFYHYNDGATSTYNTTINTSQACYNGQISWNFESGTSIDATNLYSEYSGTPTNTNTDGYTNTKLDFFVAAKCNHSTIRIGSLFNNDTTHVLAPLKGINDAVIVLWGGMRVFGSAAYKLPY